MNAWRILGTEWLLDQWGLWARVPEEKRLGFPKLSNFAKLMGGSIPVPEIELNQALAVDRIVKISALIDEEFEIVLVQRHVKKRSVRQIGRYLGRPTSHAERVLMRAQAWVDGYLCSVVEDLNLVGKIDLPDEAA